MNASRSRISRALSAQASRWQSHLAVGALLLGVPAAATPGGEIGTLATGEFMCELPGDASGPVGTPVPEEGFTVVNASSYAAAGAVGSYLLTGDTVVMTSGPFQGKRYHRLSNGFVRLIGPDGKESALRCVRRKRNNS